MKLRKYEHLGTITDTEVESLHQWLVRWLMNHGFAGSIASDYSLYEAIDDEVEKARAARNTEQQQIVHELIKGGR